MTDDRLIATVSQAEKRALAAYEDKYLTLQVESARLRDEEAKLTVAMQAYGQLAHDADVAFTEWQTAKRQRDMVLSGNTVAVPVFPQSVADRVANPTVDDVAEGMLRVLGEARADHSDGEGPRIAGG